MINNDHKREQLSAFVNHELSRDEQQEVAEHLMQCADCRAEHDEVKLGSSLAACMVQQDAPAPVWNAIDRSLDGRRSPQIALIGRKPFSGIRELAGYAVALLVVAGLITVVYFALFRAEIGENRVRVAITEPQLAESESGPQIAGHVPDELPANTTPANIADLPPITQAEQAASLSAWQFETIAGSPKVGASSGKDRLAVGDFMETDAASRARIAVADIGNVEIQPNSLVKLVGTDPTQHRLSLERGRLRAQIFAPPRLFIVDTPSAVAVDLGCEYTLDVDKGGNSFLHVTSGFVALERDGRESIVPAGAMCMTRRGKGLGTPFSAETSAAFKAALERFDFAGGGSVAVGTMLENRGFYDMITLWHLLSRVPRVDRPRVYDALAAYVEPPADVTREGILSLNKKMLESWRVEVESAWFS